MELTRGEAVALLAPNRPDALNAPSFGIHRELAAVLDQVAGREARALRIGGAGDGAFRAGADIKERTDRSWALPASSR